MKGEGRGRRGEREGLNKDNTVEKKREIEVSMFKDRNYRKERQKESGRKMKTEKRGRESDQQINGRYVWIKKRGKIK